MEPILEGLCRNSIELTEVVNLKVKGTALKEKEGREIEKELLKNIGDDDKEFAIALNNIEDEISNLIVQDTRCAFLKGISYGIFLGMGVITKEREALALNQEIKLREVLGVVKGYNELKRVSVLFSGDVLNNVGGIFALKDCDADHAINSVTNMFYDSTMSIKDIKEKMSESYYEKYINLSLLESEFICELSDENSKKFLEYSNSRKELNNYTLINEYFNGVQVGAKIVRECDRIDKRSMSEVESMMKKESEKESV